MKKSILILLLLSFIYQNTSSFWIITAFYINRDYIAQNVCINRFDAIPVCNGTCYLQQELSADSDKKPDLPIIKIKEAQPLFYENISYQTVVTSTVLSPRTYPKYHSKFIISNLVFSLFQPPELA
ncbi:hypothetical protein [Flavobacterium sp. NKUCC04_CG]|uniref:hypothetical protein n=1 Tax=Flavobacterium sp. NKUCC04_CG TaxID=2842121 RepID=UPI001C5B102B|nr:hypothetical protein [Flavobacterium sp. NKUCC04_CG]MBW3517731.1 hypothetical protein [Flavobacterium sp. NKUCC04_CG]